jgi:cytochrome P450
VQARVLSPAAIAALREPFTAAAEALVDALVAQREFDAIPALAEAYPLEVFPDAMGMPRDNRRHLLPWGNLVFNSFGPQNQYLAEAIEGAREATPWVVAQSRRENLSPGGFGAGIHEAADRGELTAEETPQVVRSVLTAGVDTTVSGIGAAVYCLARYPEQFERLRAEPKLARNAFEEAVRHESPVQTFFRTTTREVELGGETIPEGSKVLMFLGAANRDPRKWERPDEYDIGRRTVGHVGFGSGIHACVGMALARLEGECVLAALAQRVARIEITGAPRRRYNNTLRGLASLPVRLHAA